MYLCATSSSVQPLDSIAGLLDFSLLYHLWISALFLLFTWNITQLLFRIFVTEVCVSIKYKINPIPNIAKSKVSLCYRMDISTLVLFFSLLFHFSHYKFINTFFCYLASAHSQAKEYHFTKDESAS